MEQFLDKKYKLVRSENVEELLAEIGVNSFLRKIAKSLSSTTQLTKRLDGRYAIHTTALKLITQTVEFTPNQEFEEKTADGRKVKSTIVFEENKLIHTQHGEKPFTVERRFFNDEMIAVATYGDIFLSGSTSLDMEQFFNKTYILEKSENFDEFLKKLGVNTITRKIATTAKPKVSLIKNKDGTFTFASAAGILGSRYKFTHGSYFDERSMSGGKCRSMIMFNGNSMVHIQRGEHEIKIVREFSDDEMVMTLYCDDMTARRYFKAETKK